MNCPKCGERLSARDEKWGKHSICPRRIRRVKEPVRIPRKGVDERATMERKFHDADSRVFLDGREWLVGKDWEARKNELAMRSQGFCEAKDHPLPEGKYCLGLGEHPHHVIPRREKHDDRLSNLLHVCAEHHRNFHPEKRTRFHENRAGSKAQAV